MAADRRRVVVFYGDSNTYGYDPADPYEQRLPYLKRWTTVVSRNLKGYWQVIPEGMNGRTIPAMPEGSPYLIKLTSLARGDGILCTMLGTNDILQTSPADASDPVRKMEQYILFLKKHLDCSQILVIAPPLVGGQDAGDLLLRDYCRASRKMNEGFRKIASEQGVMFADASEWGIDLASDSVHFSEEGHQTFAAKMTEVLEGIRQESEQLKESKSFVIGPEMLSAGKDAKEEHYDYKAELKETLSLTDRAYEKLLYITDAMDLDDRVPDRLEEAMECLSNAVSILEEAVEDEESRW